MAFKCPLCGDVVPTIIGLRVHCSTLHGKSSQELYDLLNPGSGICAADACDHPTKFLGIVKGYKELCEEHRIQRTSRRAAATRISKHQSSWNAGLTKDIDERVMKISRAIKGKKSWNKGLTKDVDDTLLATSEKISLGLKAHYEQNEHWMRTRKMPDEFFTNYGRKTSATLQTQHLSRTDPERWRLVVEKFCTTRRERRASGEIKPSRTLTNEQLLSRLEQRAADFTLCDGLDGYSSLNEPRVFACVHCKDVRARTLASIFSGTKCACQRTRGASKWQNDVHAFVSALIDEKVHHDDRTVIAPRELDIFVPSRNFAIECHGIYWHSDAANYKREVHEKKRLACAENGIRLLQFFEDEWRDRRSIIESIIRNALRMSERKFARSLNVVDVSSRIANTFFDENHLDAGTPCKAAFGLADDEGGLYAVLSVRRPFHRRYDGMLEIARFATRKNVSVIGGFSRLIAAVERRFSHDAKGLIAYVDLRLGDGTAYAYSGFTREADTVQRFWWTDHHNRVGRFAIRACDGMPERDVARELGFVRIYGCTNARYTKVF